MRQDAKLVIRMHRDERELIDKLARLEGLPTATFARKLLLDLAEVRGLSREQEGQKLSRGYLS